MVTSRQSRYGFLHNRGEVPFEFDWHIGTCRSVSVEPSKGRLLPSASLGFSVHYHPVVSGVMKRDVIQCRLRHGPCFRLLLLGTARQPKIQLSFEDYDFGTVFVRAKGMSAIETRLVIRSRTKRNMHLRFVSSHRDLTVTIL